MSLSEVSGRKLSRRSRQTKLGDPAIQTPLPAAAIACASTYRTLPSPSRSRSGPGPAEAAQLTAGAGTEAQAQPAEAAASKHASKRESRVSNGSTSIEARSAPH